ncbi:Vacuolar protein sorting-associated protein 62 [Dinochytrium kinnereticum]|nr:Vacuolar protein sorting-associated protein 62 [Dinochytrium kinnereticum]
MPFSSVKNLILAISSLALVASAEPAVPRSPPRFTARAAPAEYEQLARTYAPLIRFQLSERQFLGKSTPLGRVDDHVGDWERFVVRTQYGQAISLDYYTHGGQGARVIPVNDRNVQWVGTHPVVYSALGSHGSWPQAKSNVYKTVIGLYDLVDDTGDNGVQWQTWLNVNTIIYRPGGGYAGSESWLNYKGRFGNKGETDCWYYSQVGSCMLATGPVGPNRNLLGPPGQVLASPGGASSTVTFEIDAGIAARANALGLGFVGVHLHCPGTSVFGDSGDVERWGVVPFKGVGDLKYTIITDRCRKGRDRHVDNYEVAFCTSTDANSCTRKSGYRNVKVFNAGARVNELGVVISDPDPWVWNL